MVLTNQPLDTPLITSQSIGIERLAVNLNQFMYQANQATVSFAELQGLNFIVLRDIGPWRDIIQQAIPNAQFFYQEQRAALLALTKSANLPFFTTNLSIFDPTFTTNQVTEQRVCLPINDVAAQMTVYATYLHTEKTRVQPLITQLSTHWPN
ncbi:LysR family transcriptional regulator [Levilactobacillus brevis]|uniref:LysR family transcriptional regulator n=1 Tax=Levilactobacillus brevis TaxID=1580 RepID=UPI001CFF92B2|nr:LysR family transcriptional regulator [Levilactobacillus brevis]MCB5232706.1 LysR family transcriptional regulator [Levilactobacillus brevis]